MASGIPRNELGLSFGLFGARRYKCSGSGSVTKQSLVLAEPDTGGSTPLAAPGVYGDATLGWSLIQLQINNGQSTQLSLKFQPNSGSDLTFPWYMSGYASPLWNYGMEAIRFGPGVIPLVTVVTTSTSWAVWAWLAPHTYPG